MKLWTKMVCFFLFGALVQAGTVFAKDKMLEVQITNLSAKVVMTPPIVAASEKQISVYQLTAPASEALEMLAESGSTDALASMFDSHGASYFQATAPIFPGDTETYYVEGKGNSRVSAAAMILPTNDGFFAMSSKKIKPFGVTTFYLSAYDAGTEMNDETCGTDGTIPGPIPSCGGGEAYNPESGEGFIHPHPGTHGEADVSVQEFSWADPVVKVTVRIVR